MFLLLLVSLYYFLAITHNLATFAIPAIPTLPQCQLVIHSHVPQLL